MSEKINMALWFARMNEKQKVFFKAKKRYVGYGGSRGGGKSWAMRMKFVLLAMQYMDLKLLLLRRTLPELRENHILPLQTLLTGIAKYNSDEKAFLFRNGSRLKLGYCDSDADMSQYQGQEYDVIGFEEATAFQEHWIQFILTCNRSTRDDFKPQAYFTMNPGGPSHGYIKRIFIDKEYKDSENAADYEFIQAKVYDNTVLMETNPEYINVLKALPEHLRKAHLDGDWNVFFGQVFSEFNEEDHVEEPFEIPKSWPRILAMDWGYTKPYAVLWGAIDYDGCIHIYRELYGCVDGKPDTGVQEVPQVVSRKIRVYKDKLYLAVGDPAMWAKQKGKSVAEDMRPLQLLPAKNDRIQGWLQIHMRLKDKQLKIFRTCRHLIRTLPMATYDKNKPEDVDTTQEDHLCLVGETLISTHFGKVQIQDVLPGNYVLTTNGFKQVTASECTGEQDTYTALFTNGATITGTADHPVYTPSGKVRIDSLRYSDIIVSEESFGGATWQELKRLNTKESSLGGIQTRQGSLIERIINRLDQMQTEESGHFILKCGETILVKFLKAVIFTTKTEIQPTTQSKTLNVSMGESTYHDTTKERLVTKNSLPESDHLQSNGMDQKQGLNGTGTTLKARLVKMLGRFLGQNVTNVEKITKKILLLQNKKEIISAQTTVNLHIAGLLALILYNEFVRFVVACLIKTNTLFLKLVPENVVRFHSLTPNGKAKVYNITVEGNHQYFANGILVSNCDTLRYLLMARIFRPQLEAKKKKPEAWAEVKEESNSWMGL